MENFAANAGAALKNDVQRQALRRAAETFAARRTSALQLVPEWEAWRTQARAVKDHVLLYLDHYLEQFSRNAEQAGCTVHWATDAAAACGIVRELCARHGVTLAVKSKSMTTEEIHLNDALAHHGVDAVETDLGEWIQQLADETPFHIVVPAIHKTEGQIAALLHDKIGTPAGADAETLTAAARAQLRERFAKAGIGISGANFGIAATGSLLILENEGNARRCTSPSSASRNCCRASPTSTCSSRCCRARAPARRSPPTSRC
jgi:L-lactate dehydrogenase complex protein LldF